MTRPRLLLPGLLLALLPACGEGTTGAASDAAPRAGAEAVTVVDLDGLDAALARRRGQGYLLNFWAIWCGPCVEELPELLEVAEAWRPRGGDVVGVSYDLMIPGASRATVSQDVARFNSVKHLGWQVLVYDGIDYETINARFDLPGEVPVTLAVDGDGRIVDRQHGKAGRARFEQMMRRALGEEE